MASTRVTSPRAERGRQGIAEGLRRRQDEIERAALVRAHGVAAPASSQDLDYANGLRDAISATIDHVLALLERREREEVPAPLSLLAQARHAARVGVGLDTVLRRCLAGFALLGEFILQEAEGAAAVGDAGLEEVWRAVTALFDRLVAAVAEEYGREAELARPNDSDERRASRVKALLAGERIDARALEYPLDGWHVGVVAEGPETLAVARALAVSLDRRLLTVDAGGGVCWLWFGGRRPIAVTGLLRRGPSGWTRGDAVGVGEPASGVEGWRLTHRQAKTAMPIARRREEPTRYADVGLLTACLGDEVLTETLRALYLEPLRAQRDGGRTLHKTLRAYFAANRNVSSTAIALEVSRKTVNNRLRTVEQLLGKPLDECRAEVEEALRMDDYERHPAPPGGWSRAG